MKSKLLALMLLAGTTAFGAVHFSFGVGIGVPYPGYYSGYYYAPPPVVAPYAYAPYGVAPGPGYVWIAPYYYPVGARWAWRAGYWTRPPYAGARWVAPRYYGRRWYRGYWRR